MKEKKMIALGPELYLIAATIYYWTLTANTINPIAITLLLVLTYQIIYKKIALGLVIGIVFVLANMYLILALFSELLEFTELNQDWRNLLIFGLLFLGFNITAGLAMLFKYIRKSNKYSSEGQ